MTALRRNRVELACIAFGSVVLAGTVWVIGVDSLARDLRLIGWGLVVILMVESLNVGFNTAAWALAFPRGERRIGLRRLVAARLAGDGVNYLTPSATVGGELLRVRLLSPEVPASLRWASVSVAKIGQSFAQAVFILLGLAVAMPRLLRATRGTGSPWLLASALGGVGALVVGAAFVWMVARGFWATARDALARMRLGRFVPLSWAGFGRDLDAALARLGPWRSVASLACFVLGWAVGAAEIYLVLLWVGDSVDWQTALALETGSVLLDGMLFFVPAKVGTQEGGKVALFAALGLSPARGLTVGVVRRIRELAYAGLGLIALAGLSARPRGETAALRVDAPRSSLRV